jgi:hypothetical protein
MFGIESYKNKDELLEEQYKAKYLKYKQKYLELKQSGGQFSLPSLPSSTYAYLTTESKAVQLVALFNKCKKNSENPIEVNVNDVNLTANINTVINLEDTSKKTEFETLVASKKNEFETLVKSENAKFQKLIESKKNSYTNEFNNFLTKCNTPNSSEIVNLLNDEAYKIKKGTNKIELIHSTSLIDKAKKQAGTQLKKNSSTISNKTSFVNEDATTFKNLLESIKTGNQGYANYTVPTHYVLIDESLTSYKLVGDGLPKPIPQ